jgi:cell division protein FtsN
MAAADSKEVTKVLEEIERLQGSVNTASVTGQEMLQYIAAGLNHVDGNLPKDANGAFDPAGWNKRTDEQKHSLYQQLLLAKEDLTTAAGLDGPADESNIMFKKHASNRWVVALTVLAFVSTVIVLRLILQHWPDATRKTASAPTAAVSSPATAGPVPATPAQAPAAPIPAPTPTGPTPTTTGQAPASPAGASEADVLWMIILMGALGGLLHLTSSLAKFVGNRRLLRSWVIYYLLMPLEGASLAPIVFLLLRIGVLSPATSSNGDTANLNLIGLYGFAALTGLFSKQAIEMLAEVFSTIFAKVKGKDSLPGQASGKTEGSAGP